MSGPLAAAFFWIAVVATAVAHAFILRSTIRGMRVMRERAGQTGAAGAPGVAGTPLAPAAPSAFWEWTWAILPALSLIVLFVWTWHTMYPATVTIPVPAGGFVPGSIGT